MPPTDEADPTIEAFLRERGRMQARVYHRVGCHATAADLIQDLFLRFWRVQPTTPGSTPAYLARSARNIAIDHQRSAALRDAVPLADAPDQPDQAPGQDDALGAKQDLQMIRAALLALPTRARRVFLLNRFHHRSYAQIARALGVSVSTVEKDMMRAIAACREAVDRP